MDYEFVMQSTATVRECFFIVIVAVVVVDVVVVDVVAAGCCMINGWLYDKSRRRSERCCLDAYHPQNRLGSI